MGKRKGYLFHPFSLHFFIFFFFFTFSHAQNKKISCTLNDVQSTSGVCMPLKDCNFAIKNLRANVFPAKCLNTPNLFCCPTEKTLSEKKCDEWEQFLKTPKGALASEPLKSPVCTLDNRGGFIVGGRDSELYEYPSTVAIGYGQDPYISFDCGGSLISEKYILTAAHCLRNSKGKASYALVGDINLESGKSPSPFRKLIKIETHILHPEYKSPVKYNDIALFKLSAPVSLSRYIYPACLPSPQKDKYEVTVEATGWGLLGVGESQSQTLQAVNLTILSNKDCDTYLESPDSSLTLPNGIIKSQICSGDKDGKNKDTCNGDSGGPILGINTGKIKCLHYALGITSFGSRFCGFGSPGVYTKVQSYIDWIERTVWG